MSARLYASPLRRPIAAINVAGAGVAVDIDPLDETRGPPSTVKTTLMVWVAKSRSLRGRTTGNG